MKAVFIARRGAPEALQVREIAEPEPGPKQVRVRVRAAGVNFADVLMRMGLYPGAPPLPFVPGYEIAGEIDAIGPGVEIGRLGERVACATAFGGYAEKVVVPADWTIPLPEGKTFEEAAALPVNYLTAYHALYVLGNLRQGGSVLVHGAAGGVGVAAVQLSGLRGATIIGTASSAKHAFVMGQGAQFMLGHGEDFEARTLELTRGRGVDIVLDPVGGRSFRKSYRCLAPAGLLVCYGISASAPGLRRNPFAALWAYLRSGFFSPLSMMGENRGVVGLHIGRLSGDEPLLRHELNELHRLWSEGRITPRVDQAFPVAHAPEAHRRLQDRKNIGKVVLTF